MNRKLKWLIRGVRRKQDSLIPMFAMYSGCLLALGILLGRGSWTAIFGFVFAAAMWIFALVRLERDINKDIAEIKELRGEISRTLVK